MFGNNGLISRRRFFLFFCVIALYFIIAMFFTGVGYALLIMSFVPALLFTAYFWDMLGFCVFGRERYQINRHNIDRIKESTHLKIFVSFHTIMWFALALSVILYANIRLIDVF